MGASNVDSQTNLPPDVDIPKKTRSRFSCSISKTYIHADNLRKLMGHIPTNSHHRGNQSSPTFTIPRVVTGLLFLIYLWGTIEKCQTYL